MLNVDLTGRRALVTGANSGIGEAIAMKLAEAGADIAINYVANPDAAARVADAVRQLGRRTLVIQADISDPGAVSTMFPTLSDAWGGIDILVNNAGIDGKSALAWESDLDAWKKVLEVNLFGTFQCCRQALQRMIRQGSGVIVNLSSVHETIPWSGFSSYTSSKAAISMLTKTLAQEAAPHGVRVVAVAPGAIKTTINQNVWGDAAGLADLDKKIPSAEWAVPRRSPTWWPCWPRISAAMSPAPRCSWTEACWIMPISPTGAREKT